MDNGLEYLKSEIWRRKAEQDKARQEYEQKRKKMYQLPEGVRPAQDNPLRHLPQGIRPADSNPLRALIPADNNKNNQPEKTKEGLSDQLLRYGEYAATGAYQGLSLGWADEIEGALGGLGYALGSLNPEWNKNGESFSEAFKRGYRENRDYRRQKLNEGYKEAPLLTRSAEVAGAVASPVRFFKAPKTAPLGMKAKKELLNDMTAGIMYGMGSGQDTVKDHAAKMAIGGTTSYWGSNLGNQIYGRGAYPIKRTVNSQLLGSTVDHYYGKLTEDKEIK